MESENENFWKDVVYYGLWATGIVLVAAAIVALLGWGDPLLKFLYEAVN